MTIRGIFRGRDKTADESPLLFHWEYLNEGGKRTMPGAVDTAGWYLVGVADPERAAQVSLAIDGMFRNALAETLTETEKAFNLGFITMTGAIITVIRLVSLAVIAIIMVVAANTMAMTARERTACVVGRKTAARFGWKLGQTITLRGTIYPGEWPLTIRGIFRGRDRSAHSTLGGNRLAAADRAADRRSRQGALGYAMNY